MKKITRCALALAVCALALPSQAQAQFAKTEDAVKYRQSAMFMTGQHFYRIRAMVEGEVPFDAASATANAQVVAELARLPWPAFAPGTEGGKAKADVWKDAARFKSLGNQLVADSDKLVVAAKTNNLDTLKAQFAATIDTCKTCHKGFKNR